MKIGWVMKVVCLILFDETVYVNNYAIGEVKQANSLRIILKTTSLIRRI
jgi:hypothetical protein